MLGPVLAALLLPCAACAGTPAPPGAGRQPGAATAGPTVGAAASTVTAMPSDVPDASVSKLLVFVVENHSLTQMRSQMPYTASLAERFGYATDYVAIRHPSLPNYIA